MYLCEFKKKRKRGKKVKINCNSQKKKNNDVDQGTLKGIDFHSSACGINGLLTNQMGGLIYAENNYIKHGLCLNTFEKFKDNELGCYYKLRLSLASNLFIFVLATPCFVLSNSPNLCYMVEL